MRIEDGGARAKNYQFGDYFYFADSGPTYLIECKATREKSFPIAQLRTEQMAKLKTFDELSEMRHSVIAINFWDEPYRSNNDCILILYPAYERLFARAVAIGRASIPREWLEREGRLQEPILGTWHLDFASLTDSKPFSDHVSEHKGNLSGEGRIGRHRASERLTGVSRCDT